MPRLFLVVFTLPYDLLALALGNTKVPKVMRGFLYIARAAIEYLFRNEITK